MRRRIWIYSLDFDDGTRTCCLCGREIKCQESVFLSIYKAWNHLIEEHKSLAMELKFKGYTKKFTPWYIDYEVRDEKSTKEVI